MNQPDRMYPAGKLVNLLCSFVRLEIRLLHQAVEQNPYRQRFEAEVAQGLREVVFRRDR